MVTNADQWKWRQIRIFADKPKWRQIHISAVSVFFKPDYLIQDLWLYVLYQLSARVWSETNVNPLPPKNDHVKFPLRPHQKYYTTQYGERGLLRWEMIILPILTTSLIHFSLGTFGECTFWTWEWKGWNSHLILTIFSFPSIFWRVCIWLSFSIWTRRLVIVVFLFCVIPAIFPNKREDPKKKHSVPEVRISVRPL